MLKAHSQEPRFRLPICLTDRCLGIGAVLSQTDADGLEHPVAYFSRKLLPRKEKYVTIEKECLAIKLVVEAFSVYLLGQFCRREGGEGCEGTNYCMYVY